MKVIADKRPVSVKGKYLLNASIKTTMGKSFKLDIESIDPKSKRYLLSIK
jgi:ribosomal protein L1